LNFLAQHIESLIFTADAPITLEEIGSVLEESFGIAFNAEELENVIQELKMRYQQEEYAFEIVEIAEGYQFLTKGAYFQTVGTLLKQKTRKRLSRAALETLAIIAYKQPVSKSDLEKIRGVNCDYAIQKLLEKELVTIAGRSEGPGRPLLYGAGEKFMNYFGLKSMKDLPQPKEFREPENLIGAENPIEEDLAEQQNDAPSEAEPALE
jgi:segregation and condensation protein B